MKTLITILLVLGLATNGFCAISSTEGEVKVARKLKQLHSIFESARGQAIQVYNSLKTYIQDHPTQFTSEDKTKLNNLNTDLQTINTNIVDFLNDIETNFEGIVE